MGRNKRGIIFLTRCSSFSQVGWALARSAAADDGLKNRPTHKRGCLLKKLEHGVFLVFFAFICLATPNLHALDTDGDGISDEEETAQGYDPANYTHLLYVDNSHPDDSGNGLSPSTAKKSIKAGILLVQNNGEEYVVLVAAGTYTGTNNKNIEFGYPEIKLRSIDGAETTIINCENSNRAFYIRGGQTEYTWIDGFTIRNGNKANGGAIAVANNSSPVIKNCVLESNHASNTGGAFWIYNTAVTLENCVIKDNESAGRGGAYYHSMGQFTIRNCLFQDNISGSSGGAIALNYCSGSLSSSVFAEDAAVYNGGALFLWTNASAEIENCVFTENLANNGAAVCVNNASGLTMKNNLINNNYAIDKGAALAHTAGSVPLSLINNTLAFNHSGNWTDIWVSSSYTPALNITNSIITGPITSGDAVLTVNYSCTYNDYTGQGAGNINSDPQLTPSGYLKSASPCIDAGTSTGAPSEDIHGQTRPAGAETDMGCDEYTDSDADQLPDWFEGLFGSDVQPGGDEDSDTLANLNEYLLGTEPDNSDSDYDDLTDGFEVSEGYDPLTRTRIYYVDGSRPDNSGDGTSLAAAKKTIQAGLNLAKNDNREYVVLAAAGTYTGTGNKNLNYHGKDIKLRSIDGSETTIIDCENTGRAFFFNSTETENSWIDGFTVKNGNETCGGAIYCNSPIVIKNSVFDDNNGVYGGAVYSYYQKVKVSNCDFTDNSANIGGALYYNGEAHSVSNCVFIGNSTNGSGGGALYLYNCQDSIESCLFENNSVTLYGGAAYLRYSDVNFSRCVFKGNSGKHAGSVWVISSDMLLENCLVMSNSVSYYGGAIFINKGSNNTTILNSTIYQNSAASATAVWVSPAASPAIDIKNSIIWDSIVEGGGIFTVDYSDTLDDYTGQGTGNISVDPQLTAEGCLTPSSPCVDAGMLEGSPVIDIDGDFRPCGSEVDMGCDEYNPDKDGDGLPDSWEMEHFGSLDQTAEADFDNDGLNNLGEFNAGTNPDNADSDNDGVTDGEEVANALNPLDDSDPGSLVLAVSYPVDNEMVR